MRPLNSETLPNMGASRACDSRQPLTLARSANLNPSWRFLTAARGGPGLFLLRGLPIVLVADERSLPHEPTVLQLADQHVGYVCARDPARGRLRQVRFVLLGQLAVRYEGDSDYRPIETAPAYELKLLLLLVHDVA